MDETLLTLTQMIADLSREVGELRIQLKSAREEQASPCMEPHYPCTRAHIDYNTTWTFPYNPPVPVNPPFPYIMNICGGSNRTQ